jgi:hypothetical protein
MSVTTTTGLNKDNARQIKNRPQQGSKNLEELIITLIISKENYKALAKSTRSLELKAICNQYAADRTEQAFKLYRHMGSSGGISVDQADLLWIDRLQTAAHKGDAAILNIIIKSETMAIKKYETYLSNHIPTIEHLQMLSGQIKVVKQALSTIILYNW